VERIDKLVGNIAGLNAWMASHPMFHRVSFSSELTWSVGEQFGCKLLLKSIQRGSPCDIGHLFFKRLWADEFFYVGAVRRPEIARGE
jgi:hypothetical protein